jgi:hypothetical protein
VTATNPYWPEEPGNLWAVRAHREWARAEEATERADREHADALSARSGLYAWRGTQLTTTTILAVGRWHWPTWTIIAVMIVHTIAVGVQERWRTRGTRKPRNRRDPKARRSESAEQRGGDR